MAAQPTTTGASRRGAFRALAEGGAALAFAHPAPAFAAGNDPLLALELRYLSLEARWLELNRAEDDECAGGASQARRKELERITMTAVGDANDVADEIAATVPTTLDGLAVQLRRLLETAHINAEERSVEHARRALDAIAALTGRPQGGPLRTGIEAELAREEGHG